METRGQEWLQHEGLKCQLNTSIRGLSVVLLAPARVSPWPAVFAAVSPVPRTAPGTEKVLHKCLYKSTN